MLVLDESVSDLFELLDCCCEDEEVVGCCWDSAAISSAKLGSVN